MSGTVAPVVPDADARPEPGERCVICLGPWWWSERDPPRRGWRCACCHAPPFGLAVVEIETE